MLETNRCQKILKMLTYHVRIASTEQLGRTFFAETKKPARMARQWAIRARGEGLLTISTVMAHPEIPLVEPIIEWRPGDPEPNFHAACWRLQSRWTEPVQKKTIIAATRQAKALTGGPVGGRPTRAREVTHDLHVTQLFLNFREQDPEIATRWVLEDALYNESHTSFDSKLPDAVIRGTPDLVIEFGGSYAAKKLACIHACHANNHQPYQIW